MTDDALLTNDHAITFAKAVFEQRVKSWHVDLTPCNQTRKK